jgi:hypothetical protein
MNRMTESPWESNQVDKKPREEMSRVRGSPIRDNKPREKIPEPRQRDNKNQQGPADDAGEASTRIPGVSRKKSTKRSSGVGMDGVIETQQ